MLNAAREVKARKQIITTIWCSASSVAYLKRLRQPIILYGDDFAQQILSFLPYNEVYDLNMYEDTPIGMWAASKFAALKQMNLQDIHIDSDVFLKTQKLIERIQYGIKNSDLIIQSIEGFERTTNHCYQTCFQAAQLFDMDFINGANGEIDAAYNCGLVGFNNCELKQKYLENYYHCKQQITDDKQAQQWIYDNNCWFDLLAEQKNLYDIAHENYKVFNLLGSYKQAYINAKHLGYQHVLGNEKWKKLYDIKLQLKMLSPSIYRQTEKAVETALTKLKNYNV